MGKVGSIAEIEFYFTADHLEFGVEGLAGFGGEAADLVGDLILEELLDDVRGDIFLRNRFPDNEAAAVAPVGTSVGFFPDDHIAGTCWASAEGFV